MARRKILIVDDEKLVRWALAKKCAECGYESVEAADGEEAMRIMQNESPDAILLDFHLPGQSGIEVLERLKQGGDTRGWKRLLMWRDNLVRGLMPSDIRETYERALKFARKHPNALDVKTALDHALGVEPPASSG